MRVRFSFTLILVLLALSMIAYAVLSMQGAPDANAQIEPQTPLVNVVVKVAKRMQLSDTLSFPAIVQAKVQATILSEADGAVRRIHAQLGKPIGRGKKLFTIQQTDPVYKFAAMTTVTPVSGVVSELAITEGAIVLKGQKLATVTDPKSVKILVEVPAQDLRMLRPGVVAEFVTPMLAKPLRLKLSGVSPNVDSATGTATAELASLGKNAMILRPGLIGTVTFKANPRKGYLVPEDVIVDQQNQAYLRVVENDRAILVPVTVTGRTHGMIEISKGLKDGAKVISRMSGFVGEGDAVKVQATE